MDESIQLNPKVKVSDLDLTSLPLRHFHMVILVEPDPETWLMPENDIDSLSQLLEMYAELIIDDVFGDIEPGLITAPAPDDVKETFMIIVGEGLGGPVYFVPAAEFSDFIVNKDDFEFYKLCMLLDGIARNDPAQNRVAIVGGMYGDEIVRVANAVQAAGFDATIIKRYCISEDVFVNLDELFDALNAERRKFLGHSDLDDDAADQ